MIRNGPFKSQCLAIPWTTSNYRKIVRNDGIEQYAGPARPDMEEEEEGEKKKEEKEEKKEEVHA